MRWRTAGDINSGAFKKWADDLAQAFVRLEPEALQNNDFKGEITKVAADDIQLSRVTATGHRVRRLREHIEASGSDICFVNLQISGIGQTRQRGREFICHPLDIAIVDTSEEFEIQHVAAFDLYSLALPKSLLPDGLLERGGAMLSRSGVSREIAQTLLNYASLALHSGSRGPVPLPVVTRHIVDLLACLNDPLENEDEAEPAQGARLAAMCNFIQRNLEDDRLSAEKLAVTFGVSSRYVHKLFAATDQTVSEYVCELRIERACQLLGQPDYASKTIIELALHIGFRDVSYFNRRFKQGVGETPSEYRKRTLTQYRS
jgi:AraC family transcriptional activator of tynA and feaB